MVFWFWFLTGRIFFFYPRRAFSSSSCSFIIVCRLFCGDHAVYLLSDKRRFFSFVDGEYINTCIHTRCSLISNPPFSCVITEPGWGHHPVHLSGEWWLVWWRDGGSQGNKNALNSTERPILQWKAYTCVIFRNQGHSQLLGGFTIRIIASRSP
jgi:hypothetical protein